MNLCKTTGSGITSRTKSLREKFSSKRSYSELIFKDISLPSSSLDPLNFSPNQQDSPHSPSKFKPDGHVPKKKSSSDLIKFHLSKNEFSAYNLLPEEAFCSALDINSGDADPRFPWQQDVAIQCDLLVSPLNYHPYMTKISEEYNKDTSSLGKKVGTSTINSFRFWKTSSNKNKPTSLLHRAASFGSKGCKKLYQDTQVSSISPLTDPKLTKIETKLPLEKELSSVSISAPQSRAATPPSDAIAISMANLGLNINGKVVTDYMNLPSPNVHEGEESNPVFKKLTDVSGNEEESEPEESLQEPPASALHRRLALVPSKSITDGYDNACDDAERVSEATLVSSNLQPEPNFVKTRRRSSIVVIPPMQICPGDLLVYNKVLTYRNDLFDSIDGSTQCLAVNDDVSRKAKNSWSLLKFFDRSNRTKSDSLCGLEELLSNLTPSVFVDEQLSKYMGMSWCDFVSLFEERRSSSIVSGYRLPNLNNESRRSSGQSTATLTSNATTSTSLLTKKGSRAFLQRNHTFDSSSSTETPDESLVPAIRSNSCSVPVDSNAAQINSNINQYNNVSNNSSEENSNIQSSEGLNLTKESLVNEDIDASPPKPPANNQALFELPDSPSGSKLSISISRSEQKRREALWDLFQSECAFLYCHLMVLKNVFMEPLKKIQVEGFAMFAEPEVLFGNLDELCCVTYAFCKEYLSLILQQINSGDLNPSDTLVRLFQKSSKATALTKAYHRYTLNYINALNYLETLRRQLEFNEFEKWCSRDPRCKKLQLTDLLVSPVQHIMRVPLILKDIEMRTEEKHERETIASIIKSEENSLRELDDKMRWLKNFERLLEIQRNIVWPSVLELDPKVFIPEFLKGPLLKQPCERLIVSPRRQIIIEGPLHILDSGKSVEMYVILFDDMLIITRRKKGLHKKQSSLTEKWAITCNKGSNFSNENLFKYVVYKQPLSLDRFYIHDVSAQDCSAHNLKYAFVLVCLNRFQQVITIHTFQAASESIKILWLSKLRDTVDKWIRTLQNTAFRNQPRIGSSSGSGSTTASTNTSRVRRDPLNIKPN